MTANLFDPPLNVPSGHEVLETILQNKQVRIQRIVSNNHHSAEEFWYDQDEHEFVVVLQGHAKLDFEQNESVELGAGDWVHIPAKKRHRVQSTSAHELTIWLAIFWPVDS